MAFLALASQKSLLTLQKNFLQFQLLSIMNQTNYAASQMTAIDRQYAGTDSDASTDPNYIYYEDLSNQLETEKDSITKDFNELRRIMNDFTEVIKTKATDEDLKGDSLKEEILRSKAIEGIAKEIISNANIVLQAKRHTTEYMDKDMPKMLEG